MNKNMTRLFADIGINQHQDIISSSSALVPDKTGDQNIILSPIAGLLKPQPSIDTRLRQGLKPVIGDRSVLKPARYHFILKDIQAALANQVRNEKEQEAKEALTDLMALLQENAELMSLLDQYMNHIQKA